MILRVAHYMPPQRIECPDCHGEGHVTVTTRQHHSGEQEVACERCEGDGEIENPEWDGDTGDV